MARIIFFAKAKKEALWKERVNRWKICREFVLSLIEEDPFPDFPDEMALAAA
jgi:hypothetical protein